MVQAHVGQAALVQVRQRGRHAVQIGFGPDQPVIGQQVRARQQMLARPDADLQVERPGGAEQPLRRDRALGGHGDPGQQPIHQPLLVIAQRLPL